MNFDWIFQLLASKLQIIISKYFEIKREELPFIHIGKQSAGWKFYFNHNDWQYFTNKETLIKWLYTVEIFDEYSTIHTTDGFLNNHLNRIDGDHAINFKKQYPSCNIEKDGLDFANSTEFR
jgi:hypothetical protein